MKRLIFLVLFFFISISLLSIFLQAETVEVEDEIKKAEKFYQEAKASQPLKHIESVGRMIFKANQVIRDIDENVDRFGNLGKANFHYEKANYLRIKEVWEKVEKIKQNQERVIKEVLGEERGLNIPYQPRSQISVKPTGLEGALKQRPWEKPIISIPATKGDKLPIINQNIDIVYKTSQCNIHYAMVNQQLLEELIKGVATFSQTNKLLEELKASEKVKEEIKTQGKAKEARVDKVYLVDDKGLLSKEDFGKEFMGVLKVKEGSQGEIYLELVNLSGEPSFSIELLKED